MAGRINAPPRLTPKIVRPTASPVDTYVAPARGGAEDQLAAALADLAPSMTRFLGRLGEEKSAKERQEGEAAARQMAAEGKTFADAVKSGVITPDQNPWFRVGAYETFGRVSGMNYIGDFLEALGKSDVSESHEVEDFDKFEREFREKWVAQTLGDEPDSFLANAFGTTADGQISSLRNEFARAAGARLVRANKDAFQAEVFLLVQQSRDLSPTELEAAIRVAQDRQTATGAMSFTEINQATAQAVANAAVRLKDVSVLDVLDRIPTDAKSKGFLGGTSYGAELRFNAEAAISRALDDEARREELVEKKRVKTAIQTISKGMFDALTADPGADISDFTREMAKVDPTYVPTLIAMRDNVVGGVYSDDPDVVRELAIGIHSEDPGSVDYTTRRSLDLAFAARQLTFSTYQTLSNELQQRDDAGGSGRFLRNPLLTEIEDQTYQMFGAEFPDGINTPAIRANARAAADEAKYELMQWMLAHPTATATELHTMKAEIRDRVVRRRVGLQAVATSASGQTQSDVVGQVKPAGFYVADPVQAGEMRREWIQIQAGMRNAFSPGYVAHLRANRIDPTDLKAVDKFLNEQGQWHDDPTPKP